jgi:formylglycine-generating enzyme required for sulfatase activity
MNSSNDDRLVQEAREVLVLSRTGVPACTDRSRIFAAIQTLRRSPDLAAEVLDAGFLAGAEERFREHVEPLLVAVEATRFEMGTAVSNARHFCGETLRHPVELSAFRVSAYAVTNSLFGLLDPGRRDLPAAALSAPVVDVTWYDAWVFATWMSCRLLTEAEWEFCCGAGSAGQWCCSAADLPDYAWYSENAQGAIQPVGTRKANALGLFDLHGNVWEWCQDTYDADYYSRAPLRDPVNDEGMAGDDGGANTHKVARGGGYLALAEMCRTRYRLHDPANLWAGDLGFRLSRSGLG